MQMQHGGWARKTKGREAELGGGANTSAIIMWQSNVPFPWAALGRETWGRIFDTTGAPKVMLGTKWPSMMSMWSLGWG